MQLVDTVEHVRQFWEQVRLGLGVHVYEAGLGSENVDWQRQELRTKMRFELGLQDVQVVAVEEQVKHV